MNDQVQDRRILENIAVHDRVAGRYEQDHGEIFNVHEQARLRSALALARSFIETGAPTALDFGCGSGNLTRHLLDLGFAVTAADVSTNFLDIIERQFAGHAVQTLKLNGRDLDGIGSRKFECIAVYSVLHHIPDYLGAIAELARVCAPGGVIFIDHEPTESYWTGDPAYDIFQREARRHDWSKYLVWSNYVGKLRRFWEPRYTNEGDIHVWPDDHVEWSRIDDCLIQEGFCCVHSEDYLLARRNYRKHVYEAYIGRCTDMRHRIYRRGRAE